MSIRDFDPLLKRLARQTKDKPKQAPKVGSNSRSRNAGIMQIGIGQRQFRTSDVSSAAQLGRALKGPLQEIARDFRDYVNKLKGFLPEDLAQALEPTLELAKKYCPKDTGALVASAYLELGTFRGLVMVEIGFAKGGDPDYAIYVHEIPYQHAAPTSDKFLQRAIDEDYFNIVQRVTDIVRARMGG